MEARQSLAAVVVLAALVCPRSALAQVELPKQNPARADGHIAAFLVCRTCGQRNYVSARDGRRDEEGFEIAWCSTCQRDTAQKPPDRMPGLSASGREGAGGLSLPASGRTIVRPQPPPSNPPPINGANRVANGAAKESASAAAAASAEAPPSVDATQRAAAAAIVADLARVRDPSDPVVVRAAEQLTALQDAGLDAARSALSRPELPVVLAAARVLLGSPSKSDAELVVERVRGKAPGSAGPALLELLVELDPVLVSPRFLASLLESPHAGVRSAAERHLRAVNGPELLPILTPLFGSKQGETRLRALGLIASIDDPSVTELLLTRLSDPTAKVAAAALSFLAASRDPGLDAELLGRAFRQRWILREGSYALLALVEREDLQLTPILDESHAEALLAGLESNNPFVAGACATALAGIGFRSTHTKATGWLDRSVVDRLVVSVSGQQYHDDFTALSSPALRRLKLLSGEDFGSDGPRWVAWWLGARERFYARRAHIEVEDADAPSLVVRLQSSGESAALNASAALKNPAASGLSALISGDFGVDLVLMTGTAAGEGADRPDARDVLYLTDAEARDALTVLRREGVFGAERLPGVRGQRGSGERVFDLKVAGRGKSFVFAADATEPWFERICDMARALADTNRWQRYPRPRSDSLSLWREESGWWSGEHTPEERATRLKDLVLRALPGRGPRERENGLAELERLYALPKVVSPDDFLPLLALLRGEATHDPRVTRIVRLALQAARASAEAAGASGEAARAGAELVPVVRGGALIDVLYTTFGQDSLPELVEVATACGPGFTNVLARDPRPFVRVAAAKALALRAEGSGEAAAVLLALIDDTDLAVERAAIEACGEQRVESARTELLVRARLGTTELRAAALEAIGRLGGELVLEALAVGLADPDPHVRVAATRGLGELGGSGSVSLLLSVLGTKDDEELSAAASAGLAKLGPMAWPDLLRVVNAPAHNGRRAAALILAEQAAPEAASALITMLTGNPRDAHIASELAILTCVDLRGTTDAASAWWDWWDGVVHDDALAWFLAALERPPKGASGTPGAVLGESAPTSVPPRSAFDGRGTLEGQLALIAAMDRPEAWLAERARRELARRLDRDLGPLPARGMARDAWLADLRQSLGSPRED
jgi:HEAT repeat protein